jgi:DNA helicase-2/ATP-dependent DNA helicase PcrA
MTRAKDHLVLIRAKNRIRYGKPVPRIASRFLEEIPKELLVRVNQSSSPEEFTQEGRQEHEQKVKNYLADIRAKLMRPGV